MGFLATLRVKARTLKSELVALYLATRDPRTPLAAKVVVLAVICYAVSPIDLIPDFIPVIGLLDDLVLVPMGIALALKMIPPDVIAEARARAPQVEASLKRFGWVGLVFMIAIWIAILVFLYFAFSGLFAVV
ncbi:MAG: YkvA family protein [Burkholderiales bacterium]